MKTKQNTKNFTIISSSSTSSETDTTFCCCDGRINKPYRHTKSNRLKKNALCVTILLLCGILNLLLGILSTVYDYQTEFIRERMRMRPGLPCMELWRTNDLDVRVGIYLFNITNADEFLNNPNVKLKLQEVGPIVYRQFIEQRDIVFHEANSTMSYTTVRNVEFLPEFNKPGILNETIITPNSALLGLAGFLNEESLFKKIGFNLISTRDSVFLERTTYQVLWNNSVPILESIKKFFPFLIPRTNMGYLYNSYFPVERRFNVKIGADMDYRKFFEIQSYNGKTKMPGYEDEERNCSITFDDARDGTAYPPYQTKDTVMYLWREDLTRKYILKYEKEVEKYSFSAYKYLLSNETFSRMENPEDDCFRGERGIELPNGLIDASKFAFGLPVAYSNPHFYGFDGPWNDYIEGLNPNQNKHSTYLIVEPETGVPLEMYLRAQYNIPMPNLRGFNWKFDRLKNMIIPSFWAEYTMTDSTTFIIFLTKLYFILPTIQPIFIITFIASGLYCIIFSIRRITQLIKTQRKTSSQETMLSKNLIISSPTSLPPSSKESQNSSSLTKYSKETESFLK